MAKSGCSFCDGKCTCDKKVSVFFCPSCRSVNVYHPFRVSNLFGLIPKWKCKDCGFEAMQFPLLATTREEIAKKGRKKVGKKKVKKTKGAKK